MGLAVLSIMPFMVCLFWCVIFLIEYRRLTKAQRVLLCFLAISSALYFCHGRFFMGHGQLEPLSDVVYSFCNIAVFPVFYLYIRRLTVVGKLPFRCYLDLIPALVICAWTLGIYLVGGDDVLQRQQIRTTVGKVVFVVQLVLVSYFGSKRLRQFDKSLEEFYSSKENRELRLFGMITFVMLACALISTISSSMGREYFSEHEALLVLPSVIFSAVLFTIAYVGHKQTFDADALEKDMEESETFCLNSIGLSNEEAYQRTKVPHGEAGLEKPDEGIHSGNEFQSGTVSRVGIETDAEVLEQSSKEQSPAEESSDEGIGAQEDNSLLDLDSDKGPTQSLIEENQLLEDSSRLRERLIELIDRDHIYLDSNLKLTDVAARLRLGRSTVSAFINQNMGVSFSDFINAKRIDHAKNLIKAEPPLSLIEVSERSGFASPSSFYRAFKKYVGVTPKDWMAKGD